MTMMDTGYVLNNNGIQFFTGRTMCARDQLGRFLGLQEQDDETVESGEEKLTAEDSLFVQLVASSFHSTDVEEEDADIDFEGIELSTSEEDECVDSEKWVARRYRAEYPELWEENEMTPKQSAPQQSAAQHDDYLKVADWADRNGRGWFYSHFHQDLGNTSKRRAIRKDREYRRQFWGDVTDLSNQDFDFTEVLKDFDDITHTMTEDEHAFIALDRAYQNGDYGYYGQWDEFEEDYSQPERISYGFYGDERDDYDLDDDYDFYDLTNSSPDDWRATEDKLAAEKRAEDEAYAAYVADYMAWYEIDQYVYQQQLDELADTTPIHQHGGARGWKAAKISKHKILEAA